MNRSSDIVEAHSERALVSGLGGLVALAIATLLFIYGGEALRGLAIILGTAGLVGCIYGLYCAMQVRKVVSFDATCTYCKAVNKLAEPVTKDFTCSFCHRLVPVLDGAVLAVSQVRCGYCNELNYYSQKTEVLLCEFCNHDIPIANDSGRIKTSVFAVKEDDRPYELRLVAYTHGAKEEEMITTLQHMLALNRNQVKDILADLPALLLTGIPKKKAEMLGAQIHAHGGTAEYSPIG